MRQKTTSPGSNICEVLAKAMRHMSNTKKNVLMWTSARVKRLKRELFSHKEDEVDREV